MYAFAAVTLLITMLAIILVRRKLGIVVEFKRYRQINAFQKRVETTFLLLFILIIFVAVYSFNVGAEGLLLISMGFLVNLTGFSTYMEYKYERLKKEYIVSLVAAIGFFIVWVGSTAFYL